MKHDYSLDPGITPTPPEPSTRTELRAVLQEQLNAKYGNTSAMRFSLPIHNPLLICSALAVGDPHARVPYKSLRVGNVIGLPPGIKLSHPSTLSQDQLQVIYDNIASIRFIGELPIMYARDSYVIITIMCRCTSHSSAIN